MNLKNAIVSIIATLVIISIGFTAHAVTKGTYAGNVPVFGDLESTKVKKESSKSTALNTVTYIEKGKLVSWVEEDETNMTVQVTYSSIGNKTMSFYANGITSREQMNLNISTSPSTFYSVNTVGNWTPN